MHMHTHPHLHTYVDVNFDMYIHVYVMMPCQLCPPHMDKCLIIQLQAVTKIIRDGLILHHLLLLELVEAVLPPTILELIHDSLHIVIIDQSFLRQSLRAIFPSTLVNVPVHVQVVCVCVCLSHMCCTQACVKFCVGLMV